MFFFAFFVLFFFSWGLEPGQGNPAQPVMMQQGWKTLVASRRKSHGQRGTTTEGGAPPLAPLVLGPTIRDRHRGGDSVTMVEVSRWCKQKREKRNKKKTKMVGLLMPPMKASRVRSYHRLAANGGGNMDRDTTASSELAKEKKKKTKTHQRRSTTQQNKGKKKKKQQIV